MGKNKSIHKLIGDKLGVSQATQDKLLEIIGRGKEIVGFISSVSSTVGTAMTLLKLAGILEPGQSEFDKLYKKIEAALKAVTDRINNVSKQVTLLNVADKKGDSESVVKSVIAYLNYIEQFGSPPPADKLAAKEIEQNISKSSDAISDLMQPDYWRRTFDENAVCQLKWGQTKYRPPAEDSGGFVWDYRLTLSALLYAISARLLILETLEPDYKTINRDEINSYADYLLGVYKKIRDGIIRTPAPQEGADKTFPLNSIPSFPFSSWELYDNPCGAVEIYSGLGFIEILPFKQPAYPPYKKIYETPEEEIRYAKWFYQVFSLRVERAWQALYKSVGLPDLWGTIVHLKQIVGEYLPVIPPDLGFSLRGVVESPVKILYFGFTGEITEYPIPYKVDSLISMRNLASTLGKEFANVPLPGSTEANPLYSSQISLRRMLAGD